MRAVNVNRSAEAQLPYVALSQANPESSGCRKLRVTSDFVTAP